jgi:hypothetical protein
VGALAGPGLGPRSRVAVTTQGLGRQECGHIMSTEPV